MADDPTFKEVSDAIKNGELTQAELNKVIQAHSAITGGSIRWKLARLIIGLYVFVVGLTAIYLAYKGFSTAQNVFSDFAELIKIAVIPVVTFVLGYYYGTSVSKS